MSLSPSQNRAIQITERVTSSFSVFGALFVIGTYTASSRFHKPINRMVFYASWGNILANVSTLISLSGIQAGQESSMCQTQAFLIQMFMPADALWTLAMALNVYLTFRHRFSSSQLRNLETKYLLLCYGLPFVPAIIYAFLRTEAKGRVYGDATVSSQVPIIFITQLTDLLDKQLWCWIDVDWDALRIATFYGPVWLIFVITGIIYISIGTEIYQKRKQLRNMTSQSMPTTLSVKTTEVHVISETMDKSGEVRQTQPEKEDFGHNRSRFETNISSAKMSSSDAAAWAYTKCAMLFFAALIITWVPSTINRVYTLVAEGEVSFALCYFEALVLPLQGFWNCIIYITTSLGACRSLWNTIFGSNSSSDEIQLSYTRGSRRRPFSRIDEASESTTELAEDTQATRSL
ncbi:hypothetical protein N7532_008675 [Penicillium argentinense]|uniref:G-protein coupled receptors family 2 profile 2 domain-containing protein n=1 Tax=Penicillium argentinense TaxID=1131581 RepID=A0A9W9EY25_9EURO|nr:uncharacterized protein N7532_008675 [Penicillium argentinense]KAJ5089991.1 hypothetical protein N7532_008675 [Penicillium argentinense]